MCHCERSAAIIPRFHNNDKYVSFRNNDRWGGRGGNPLLCHCERSAAIIPRFHNNDKYVSFHSNDRMAT